MRRRARWMNTATDPILELLSDSDVAMTPGAIRYNLEQRLEDSPSKSSIHRALQDLEEYGLVWRPEEAESLVELTEIGRGYLEGDVDASELEALGEGKDG